MKPFILIASLIMTAATQAQVWDKTFPQSDKVTTEKVTFTNRYDLVVVADLYMPKALDTTQRHAAIVIGHPFGGVKEFFDYYRTRRGQHPPCTTGAGYYQAEGTPTRRLVTGEQYDNATK